jgi:hypothetical protein
VHDPPIVPWDERSESVTRSAYSLRVACLAAAPRCGRARDDISSQALPQRGLDLTRWVVASEAACARTNLCPCGSPTRIGLARSTECSATVAQRPCSDGSGSRHLPRTRTRVTETLLEPGSSVTGALSQQRAAAAHPRSAGKPAPRPRTRPPSLRSRPPHADSKGARRQFHRPILQNHALLAPMALPRGARGA